MKHHVSGFQIFWNNGCSKTYSCKSCILREASKFYCACSCSFALVNGVWYVWLGDICFICRVVDDDCSDSISVIYPLLKLCFCDCGSCRVIRETQINDVRCLFRQCRCKVCFFCTRHVDHIAPCLCLCIVSSGTSCHYICINVHRVNRVTHCNLTVCRKNFLNISWITFCTIRNKDFVCLNVAAFILIIILCHGAS